MTSPRPPVALERLLESGEARVDRVEPLPGDVSARRYYRLHLEGGGTAVAAVYPTDLAGACRRFLRTGALLASVGVRVPGIELAACERSVMIVEDLGDRTLFDLGGAGWEALAPWYAKASAVLVAIRGLPRRDVEALGNEPLGTDLLLRELDRTWAVLIEPRRLLPRELSDRLREVLTATCGRMGDGDLVPCHRDLMARNLVPLEAGELAILDHQDLRLGPSAYDLASLLNDSLFPPPELEEALLAEALPALGLGHEAYHDAALHRTLKAAGTFAAAATARHERLLPATLGRALRHLRRVAGGADLAEEVERLWRGEIC